eukprot:TRINITY_DN5375_c0_g1_i4.p1 TRINITY_DN5375_c0_g1~~TRINITY_DN5375_c0_g1_i4.p1  ORF type:complete len:654 (-),score=82.18 TRINITY_DN5375_c0_g1_i4:146-1906(-)
MKPGESLAIQLTNNLQAANNVPCSQTAGEFCEAATTNLHTHGLHVSSKGMDDGLSYWSDDVLASVAPAGGTALFNFSIPSYHMGGTYWYHPHHHHATALQAAGGAAGLLIVDDPDGYLPTEYSSMEEKNLFISGHNLNTLQAMAASAQTSVLQTAATTATNAGLATNVFLVNGQLGPSLTISGNTWYRFRMVYAAVEQSLQLSMIGGAATCTMKLIAKDGVYLHTIPRDIATVYLYPGARADVALSCACTTYPCDAKVSSSASTGGPGRRLQPGGGMGQGGDGPAEAGAETVTVDLLLLTINQGSSTLTTLPSYTPQRPCYLADLRNAVADSTGAIALNGGPKSITWNGVGTSMTYANTHANGGTMKTWSAMASLQVGQVHELTVTGANAHPLHMHVNPFQIISMGADTYGGGYFTTGDWHDTLLIEASGGASSLTLRMQSDVFTGKMVVHCHILSHEDEGMMNIIQLTGTEGAVYSQAKALDSTCYQGSFQAASPTPSPASSPTPSPSLAPSTSTGSSSPVPSPSPTPSPSTGSSSPVPSPSPVAAPSPSPSVSPPPASGGNSDFALRLSRVQVMLALGGALLCH